ncbi:IS3 family transposase [Lactococcus cremoris]|uniref:IS3 family transposase n=1 Tax=Lactococcus lactis subsp. cremoris TaxID=1359 RepID=UPI002FC9DD16
MVKRYEQGFKETLVELYDSGQSFPSLSSEYGIAQTTLYKWIDKYSKKGGQEYSKADFIAIKKELARVQEERDPLKKSIDHIRREKEMTTSEMIHMIQEEHLNITQSCLLFGLNRSSFYDQTQRKLSSSEQRRRTLTLEIKSIYEASKQIYGAPKIHHQLVQKGLTVGLKLVQKLMHEQGIKSVVNKKFKPERNKSDNLSRENLVVIEPNAMNQVWSTDITYIHTQTQGWVYLSTIMDRYSKKVIAWDISQRMTTDLVIRTLEKAIRVRGTSKGLLLHSDQGSQYTSQEYNQLLETHKIKHSYSRKGYPYHNASLESWHGHLKREWLYRYSIKDFNQAKHEVFWYIESFYNQNRIHQGLDYLTPNEFENKQQKLAA